METKKKPNDIPYQMCTKTVMDTTDPDIVFDENGVCNHYHYFQKEIKHSSRKYRRKKDSKEKLIREIKAAGKGKEYDCV